MINLLVYFGASSQLTDNGYVLESQQYLPNFPVTDGVGGLPAVFLT